MSSFGRANLLHVDEGFLLGPSDKKDKSTGTSVFVPRIHMLDGKTTGRLIVFVYYGLMLVVLSEDTVIQSESVEALRNATVARMSKLLPSISHQFSKIISEEDSYRFIYYNDSNKAFHQTKL
eukprot:GHVL01016717.1.p1 GENE.GHVL01016717.1~~GHVL01016717.1.p1  ORF type:complete len:122 (+),score=10.08 GHVL01016717.1:154-519(+)